MPWLPSVSSTLAAAWSLRAGARTRGRGGEGLEQTARTMPFPPPPSAGPPPARCIGDGAAAPGARTPQAGAAPRRASHPHPLARLHLLLRHHRPRAHALGQRRQRVRPRPLHHHQLAAQAPQVLAQPLQAAHQHCGMRRVWCADLLAGRRLTACVASKYVRDARISWQAARGQPCYP